MAGRYEPGTAQAMTESARVAEVQMGLTWPQKLLYLLAPVGFSALMLVEGPIFQRSGVLGTILFFALAIGMGLVTFVVTAGWTFKLSTTPQRVRIYDRHKEIMVPMDKIGMVVRNGGFPFPTVWLVLRGTDIGQEVPDKGVDPTTRQLIDAYRRRNPGKEVRVLSVPGGYLRSIPDFTRELKRHIPPLAVDERLAGK